MDIHNVDVQSVLWDLYSIQTVLCNVNALKGRYLSNEQQYYALDRSHIGKILIVVLCIWQRL